MWHIHPLPDGWAYRHNDNPWAFASTLEEMLTNIFG